MLLASSNHAAGFLRKETGTAPDYAFPAPDTYYGVSKVAVEALGSLYHHPPLRAGRDRPAHRLLLRPPAHHPDTRHLAVPRRLRPTAGGLARRTVPRLPGRLGRLGEHPRLVQPGRGQRPRLPAAGRRRAVRRRGAPGRRPPGRRLPRRGVLLLRPASPSRSRARRAWTP
ncbi:hypothetical protein OG689_00280 [Kitasatospora sp. NBC_00240]|nr:hypothetical protein [Kitasatospora sp. NBC_00240]